MIENALVNENESYAVFHLQTTLDPMTTLFEFYWNYYFLRIAKNQYPPGHSKSSIFGIQKGMEKKPWVLVDIHYLIVRLLVITLTQTYFEEDTNDNLTLKSSLNSFVASRQILPDAVQIINLPLLTKKLRSASRSLVNL